MPLNGDPPGRPGVKLNGHGGSSSSRRTAKRLVGGERKWAWLRGKFPTVRHFIHSFIRSFIHSFVHSFIHSQSRSEDEYGLISSSGRRWGGRRLGGAEGGI